MYGTLEALHVVGGRGARHPPGYGRAHNWEVGSNVGFYNTLFTT